MASIGIIGGTGLISLDCLEITGREIVRTPYGDVSAALISTIKYVIPEGRSPSQTSLFAD